MGGTIYTFDVSFEPHTLVYKAMYSLLTVSKSELQYGTGSACTHITKAGKANSGSAVFIYITLHELSFNIDI